MMHKPSTDRMTFTDQMGRKVVLNGPPKRIVSLVPSQTELLFDLGLGEKVVGVTHFCIHPKDACAAVTKVGGTKKFKFDRIEELEPDLVIGNKEENYEEGIHQLAEKYPVWMSDIKTLEDALEMIRLIGELTNTSDKALSISNAIKESFDKLTHSDTAHTKALYLIWRKPYMAVGPDTFIDQMLSRAGFENVVTTTRYPELSAEQISTLKPEVLLLSSEPYPFQEKHFEEFRELLPDAKIKIVDGEMFSWYGSRLLKSVNYFLALKKM